MKELKKIVDEVIRKECRKEALEILSLSDSKGIEEFKYYYNENNHNICCLHLDFLKSKLIKSGKMEDNGCFGKPFTEPLEREK
jgi:hypothetical protein